MGEYKNGKIERVLGIYNLFNIIVRGQNNDFKE